MQLEILAADFTNPVHVTGVLDVLNSYASDPISGGKPLGAEVQERLIPGLRDHPTCFVLLALDDRRAVGVAVCFFGFSTFQARPLLNIHDLAVVPESRGKGIGRALLSEVEKHAREQGCCKLTLEVQDDNQRARRLYESCGFADFVVGDADVTRFLSKSLPQISTSP